VKISLNWLKDYVSIPADLSPETIAHDLTMTTVEVEHCHSLGKDLEGIVVGKINSLRQHPNADRLRITMTDVGGEEKQIVCGGSNLREGMLVAVAKPGSKVRWHGEGELVELSESKIRGEASFGMICSAVEIGLDELFPAKADKEIIDLGELAAKPGTPLAEALGLDDIIIEIDNKSLTNRPDLWGHYGIARELAAIYSLPLKPLPEVALPNAGSKVKVKIHDEQLCRRYTATVVEGLSPGSAPVWMQRRLASVGQRPINLLVDLTNYVMLAVGQPTHAFDARELANDSIHIRRAKEKEQLELLDGSKLELTSEMLVIADDKRPVALAGIMGGLSSGIREDTATVVLESANFDSVNVRRTATAVGARTESSMRFDKGLDCDRVLHAVKLFLFLLKEIQPKAAATSHLDLFPRPYEALTVKVGRDFIVRRVGKDFTAEEILALLRRLGFKVESQKDTFTIGVPPWRATGDVSIPADIVEEVARLYGYDSLEFVPPPVSLTSAVRQPKYDVDRKLREFLAIAKGMFEVFSYPWVDEQFVRATGGTSSGFLLQDPPSPETAGIVSSLIPNLLAAAARNVRNEGRFGIFEVGRVFTTELVPWSLPKEKLPVQPKHVAGLKVSNDPKAAFLDLKGVLESLFHVLPIGPVTFGAEATFSPWTVTGGRLGIFTSGKQIGEIGVVSPKTLRGSGIERTAAAAFEFNLEELVCLPSTPGRYEPIPKFPLVEFDLSMVFDQSVPWESIREIAAAADKRVRAVHFADEYRGEQIPAGKRSIAFKMIFGDPTKTLTSEETQTIAGAVMKALEKKVGGTVRGR